MPGTFTKTYPDTTDSQLTGLVQDAYAEAKLDRLLPGVTYDLDTDAFAPTLGPEQTAIIVIYASATFARAQYLNLVTALRVQAGTTSYEKQQSATVAAAMLKDIQARRQELKDLIVSGVGLPMVYHQADAAWVAQTNSYRSSPYTWERPMFDPYGA